MRILASVTSKLTAFGIRCAIQKANIAEFALRWV